MTAATRVASIALTAGLLAWAAAIGGGVPLSLGTLADAARSAATNAAVAERNTARAARSTEALATIARDVASQVRSARRVLATQLEVEELARAGARRSTELVGGIRALRTVLRRLSARLDRLAALSGSATSGARATAAAGDRLAVALDAVMRRYQTVVAESRELNRKAEGYERLRELP